MTFIVNQLSNICKIGDGAHASLKRIKSGIMYLTAKNITINGIDLNSVDYISEETYNKHFKEKSNALTQPKENDILYSIIGSIGGCYIVKNEKIGVSSSVAIIRCIEDIIAPKFLYYYLKSDSFNNEIQAIKSGVAQGFMSLSKLGSISIKYPKDLLVQHRIASILSAYDDLIENNQKQIKLLEEVAQRLYKEWFVDLRFPGYEDVEIIDGVPEGWRKTTVNEMLEMNIGGGWGKETPTGKNTIKGKVIRGTDINDIKNGDFSSIPERYHTENDIKKRSLCPYDIVFELSNGNINNIGRCLLIDSYLLEKCGENTICASFCKLLRPLNRFYAIMLFLEINDMQISGRMMPLKKHGSNGINNFDFDSFLNHVFLVPNNDNLIITFVDLIKKISHCQYQLTLLKESRDRLLPKLMSGELEV